MPRGKIKFARSDDDAWPLIGSMIAAVKQDGLCGTDTTCELADRLQAEVDDPTFTDLDSTLSGVRGLFNQIVMDDPQAYDQLSTAIGDISAQLATVGANLIVPQAYDQTVYESMQGANDDGE